MSLANDFPRGHSAPRRGASRDHKKRNEERNAERRPSWRIVRRQVHQGAPACDVEAILGDMRAQPWLEDRVVRLAASPALFDRCLAVAILARLSLPRDPKPAVAALLAENPGDRAVTWYRALIDAQRASIDRTATKQAEALTRALATMPQSKDAARAWITKRDDLECVAFLAGSSPVAGAKLASTLAATDSAARAHSEVFSQLIEPDDRLCDVGVCDPLCWWSEVVT